MSGELIDRRAAMLAIVRRSAGLLSTIAVVGAGTEIDAHRVFSDVHPISPEKQRELQMEARRLVDQRLIRVGNFSPVERTVGEEKRLQRPVLHPQGIAESLLYMAYMEGGDENVSAMNTLLRKEKGLAVVEGAPGIGGLTDGPLLRLFKDSFSIALNPGYFEDNTYLGLIPHEFYHVEQQARDGDMGYMGRAIAGGVILSVIIGQLLDIRSALTASLQEQRRGTSIDRRKMLLNSLTMGIVGGFAGYYLSHLAPSERQAYVQGGNDEFGELMRQEPIKSALESIVTFEDVA